MDHKTEYQRWLDYIEDADLLKELKSIDDKAIEDAFYRDL